MGIVFWKATGPGRETLFPWHLQWWLWCVESPEQVRWPSHAIRLSLLLLRQLARRCVCSVALNGLCAWQGPNYLVNYCKQVSDISSQRHLRSASRHHLSVPRHRSVLSIVGPSLSQGRRSGTHYRTVSVTRRSATIVSNHWWRRRSALPLSTHSAVEMLHDSALYKFIWHYYY